ncbi:GPI-anchored protein LLG2 [Selaginella moellendorffii]|uniref:GPI-anchored protein LLG2 n=1 Tax=Selaginella moellendorffii TaxID=88036 RepID=UPI000D1CFCE4|nr:GPI-anchored protein LLG2 [Selaginella moellendorffii]|eukprot:XP_024537731.1 GPI-anchored protein LLG2 [Selaginella moellendorffii]
MGLWTGACLALCCFLLCCQASGSQGPMRRLSQVKAPCPFDFGTVNYTSITSVCKSPYPQKPCCDSFIALTCRYITYFNDQNTTCADEMFAYLNNAGAYPGGLFANLCVAGPEGLPCPAAPAPLPSPALMLHSSRAFLLLLNLVWLLVPAV